ncbi:MAG: hypothetical protein ABGX16_20660 [Pirellulales bacterium]
MPFSPAPNFPIRWLDSTANGPFWIALGMLWIGVAQFHIALPIATAVAVIGYGATLSTMALKPRKQLGQGGWRKDSRFHGSRVLEGMVPLINLSVYVALVGLTIASQWNLALQSPARMHGLPLVMDHGLAMLLMLFLTRMIVNRLIVESV